MDALAVLARDPERTGLFLDFDGTLARIVDDPDDARPIEGVGDALADLADRLKVVAIVSGRSAHQLVKWLGPIVTAKVELWGSHGSEQVSEGEVKLADAVKPYVALIDRVERAASSAPALRTPGVVLERKPAIVALHYRMAEDPAAARSELLELASAYAEENGLELAEGRMVIEIRPPVELSKRSVVLARGSGALAELRGVHRRRPGGPRRIRRAG